MLSSQLKTAAGALLAGLMLTAGSAQAQDYPSKDIRIIVPFKPGGAVDTTSRILAEVGNKHIEGAKLKVENRDGGGGVVGQTMASTAKPDGYTVLAMTSSVVTNPTLKQASYTVDDFQPIGLYTYDPEVIAVNADSPIKDIDDFIAKAKEAQLSIAEAGNATSHHLAGIALVENAGLKLNFVHTRGFGAQLQAVLGGHVDAALWSFGEAKPQADADAVRILAVASAERMESMPDVPTWAESGLNIDEWATFRGWAAPKGTPDDAVAYLSDLLKKISEDPDYQEKMQAQGFPLSYRDAAGFAQIIQGYDTLTAPLVKTLQD